MEFPRDIEMNIIRKLDIDSRIKLGIFTKLKIPNLFVNELNKFINNNKIKIQKGEDECNEYYIKLGKDNKISKKYKYILFKKITYLNELIEYAVIEDINIFKYQPPIYESKTFYYNKGYICINNNWMNE